MVVPDAGQPVVRAKYGDESQFFDLDVSCTVPCQQQLAQSPMHASRGGPGLSGVVATLASLAVPDRPSCRETLFLRRP